MQCFVFIQAVVLNISAVLISGMQFWVIQIAAHKKVGTFEIVEIKNAFSNSFSVIKNQTTSR